jgi:Flp pilus assembly protein TadG
MTATMTTKRRNGNGRFSGLRCLVRNGESGQAIVWVAVMLPLFLSAIGLSIDGGVVFAARRELQNAADGAARAAAAQVDLRIYRETGGRSVVLDVPRARQAAVGYLAGRSSDVTAAVDAQPRRVVVQVSRETPTAFLRIVGLSTVHIEATAPVEVRYGIDRGSR